eukprot:4679-Heterococcus_DN1.PRE.2
MRLRRRQRWRSESINPAATCLRRLLTALALQSQLGHAQTQSLDAVVVNGSVLVAGTVLGATSHQPVPGVCIEIVPLVTAACGSITEDAGDTDSSSCDAWTSRLRCDKEFAVRCMLMSHIMLIVIGTRRQGEFNFLISQDAWLAGQGIVISAYSLKGSVPSKHHVIPLSSTDADSGADYTEITILVPELAARPSSRSSTSSSRYDVRSGDLSPCDADDPSSTSTDVAAVADGADDAVHDGVHGQLAAA